MHNVEIPATNYVRVYLDSGVNGGRGVHALLVLGFGGGYFHQADPWEAENRSLVRLRVLSFLCVLHVDGRARSPCAHTCSFILPLGLIGHFHLRLGSGVCSFLAVNLVPGLNQPDKASPRSHDQPPSPLRRGTTSPCSTPGQFPYTATRSAHRCHGIHRW